MHRKPDRVDRRVGPIQPVLHMRPDLQITSGSEHHDIGFIFKPYPGSALHHPDELIVCQLRCCGARLSDPLKMETVLETVYPGKARLKKVETLEFRPFQEKPCALAPETRVRVPLESPYQIVYSTLAPGRVPCQLPLFVFNRACTSHLPALQIRTLFHAASRADGTSREKTEKKSLRQL